jgi:hypothetical protein
VLFRRPGPADSRSVGAMAFAFCARWIHSNAPRLRCTSASTRIPWSSGDLEPHGGSRGIADLGFGELAIAAAYHAGRWLVPGEVGAPRALPRGRRRARRPQRVSYGHAAGARRAASSGPGRPFAARADSCALAERRGPRDRRVDRAVSTTRALGALRPESCVENALGDRYEYALCPARARGAGSTASPCCRTSRSTKGLDAVELEAAGWMGHTPRQPPRQGVVRDRRARGLPALVLLLLLVRGRAWRRWHRRARQAPAARRVLAAAARARSRGDAMVESQGAPRAAR